MCCTGKRLLFALAALILSALPAVAIPVVPGASGVGMDTRAAYACSGNPTIYTVSSLADDGGTTTLRYALTQSGPRVVIFAISGYITLTSTLTINTPCLTVAGQTAPSPGITVRSGGGFGPDVTIYINARDVLFQHFRIRPGTGATCNSGVQVYGGSQSKVVFDHMSFSWGQDENLAFNWTNGQSTDAVVWQSIIAEGLYRATGSGACSGGQFSNGHGILIAAEAGKVAIIQSLFANNYERNPYAQGGTATTLVNNLIYQWHGPWGFFFNNANVSSTGHTGPWYVSAVGNRFIKGPHSTDSGDPSAYMFVYSINDFGETASNAIYKSDNTIANQDGTVVLESNQYSYNPVVGSAPSQAPLPVGLTALASTAVETFVLDHAGARPLDRDGVDARIISQVAARSGNFIAQPSDAGGYPTLATNTTTFSIPANPHVDAGSGYTNLEVWLQGFATALEPGGGGPADVTAATGAVIVTSHFTGTAGTALTAYTSDVGGLFSLQPGSTGVLALDNANRAMNTSINVGSVTLAAGTPVSAEYDVATDIRVLTTTTGTDYAIWGRADTVLNSGYLFSIDPAGGAAYLRRAVNGTYALLGSCSHTFSPSTTSHLILRLRNAGQHAIIDGTQCTSTTDNTITTAGKAGMSAYATTTADTNTTGAHFDDFSVTDVSSAATPVITTTTFPNTVLTRAYAATASATGGTTPYTWAVSAGALPTSLSLNTSTGAITGTPTVAGIYSFTLRVTDNVAATTTTVFSMFARAAASITTTSMPAGVQATTYSSTLVSAGDEAPYTWAITSGTLPAGLTLNTSTGVVSGTPTALALSSFTMRVTGALGSTATKALSISITAEYRPPSRPIGRNQAEGVLFRRSTAPTNPRDGAMAGDLWVNTSTTPPSVYVCTAATASAATWAALP